MAASSPVFWPFPTSTVREWPGERPKGWAYHVGTDFGVAQGTPLRATTSGTAYLIWNDGFGAYVIDIVRPDGFVVRNGHLSRMDVKNGSWVNAGDHIGLTGGPKGTTGAGLSTGPHLHWELRWNRNWNGPGWVDPRNMNILTFGGGSNGGGNSQPAPIPEQDDEDMANHFFAKIVNGVQYNAIVNPVSGFFQEFQSNNGEYNTNIARTFGVKDVSSLVTDSHYEAIRRDCALTRQGK